MPIMREGNKADFPCRPPGLLPRCAWKQYGSVARPGLVTCKIWYLISRTVSDDDAHCGDIDDRSVRAFAVKPAPSARRHAALGLTARRGRANLATVPVMHSLRCSGNQDYTAVGQRPTGRVLVFSGYRPGRPHIAAGLVRRAVTRAWFT
jgi:hypothetical protein